jgi:hypothetical protein
MPWPRCAAAGEYEAAGPISKKGGIQFYITQSGAIGPNMYGMAGAETYRIDIIQRAGG